MKQFILYFASLTLFFTFFLSPASVFAVSTKTVGSILIDSGRSTTYDRKVTLKITAPVEVKDMMISNSDEFGGLHWQRYKKTTSWYLEYGARAHTVFVRFRLKDGTITHSIHDTITLNPAKPSVKIDPPKNGVVDSRYVTVSTTFSNGIESFRYGTTKDLSGEEYENVGDRSQLSFIVPAGEGKKTIYFEFRDSSDKVIQQTLVLTYQPTGRSIAEGSVLVGQDKKYYYYGYDGRLHIFPNEQVFRSWYPSTVSTTPVSRTKIEQYKLGSPMCVRPGTYILKFTGLKQKYIPDGGCVLRPLKSTVEAVLLYGNNWNARTIELPAGYLTSYTIDSLDASDVDEELLDRDRDGVDHEEEADYGTSDRKDDTDGDGLSDYEEINFWFSDPISRDSDGDGYNDSQEILNGYSPIGSDKLTEVPEDTYMYPSGTVVRIKPTGKKKTSTLLYVRSATVVNSLGTKTNAKAFTLNNLQEKFIVDPPLNIILPKTKGSMSTKKDLTITEPYITNQNGALIKL